MYPRRSGRNQVACEHYDNVWSPRKGIWLPECAYELRGGCLLMRAALPQMDMAFSTLVLVLALAAMLFFTETGVAAFGRDHESSQQVWSSEVGYPGAAEYRVLQRFGLGSRI